MSQADPLLRNDNAPITEIGMKIIETFAKKINHTVDYLVMNETLTTVFDTEINGHFNIINIINLNKLIAFIQYLGNRK